MKSLLRQNHQLSKPDFQINYLEESAIRLGVSFEQKLKDNNLFPLLAATPEILQLNLGKMCNQVCKHCHVDAGPDRKEIMSLETMQLCLEFLKKSTFKTVDLTGGAPEMNPHFRWLVEALSALKVKIIVRCNLTIIRANKAYYDLPEFFKEHAVEVVSSLPFYNADKTDRQRGNGVFQQSIEALKMLNEVGYGIESSGLNLHLVYNPAGAFLPASQKELELMFKKNLMEQYGISFNQLYAITNMPISRYLEYLIRTENYEAYLEKLIQSFNPSAAENVMCKNTISVSWNGYLYDCDFNQMLELPADVENYHISRACPQALLQRKIKVNQHCFGCTAGSGSSCGGSTAS